MSYACLILLYLFEIIDINIYNIF